LQLLPPGEGDKISSSTTASSVELIPSGKFSIEIDICPVEIMVNPEPRLSYTQNGLLYVVFKLIKAGVMRGARNEGDIDGELTKCIR